MRLIFNDFIAAMIVAAGIFPSMGKAEWAEVGGWSIDTHTEGCFMIANYDGDITFSILLAGTSKQAMTMDIILASPKWGSISPGANYDVRMDFNRGTNWKVSFEGGVWDNGTKFLVNYEDAYSEDSGRFAQDLMKSDNVYIEFEGTRVANLNLAGSSRAFDELVGCQKSFVSSVSSDPFSSADPFSSSDPFR